MGNSKVKREKTSSQNKIIFKKRGRPKGSKNKKNPRIEQPKRKRGRPKGSKNNVSKRNYIEKIECEILINAEDVDLCDETVETSTLCKIPKTVLEQIMFKLPYVTDPLIGTPQQVQKELDGMALKMQKHPNDNVIFNKIHLYMHGYLINLVIKKFPFIRGFQQVDIYQETLIALRFKCIPKFKSNKGMSFLNFAKMCIRRHLITLLNTSKTRQKDQSMNQAYSLDSCPMGNDDDGSNKTYANVVADNRDSADKLFEASEAFDTTKNNLFKHLSDFEQVVLSEYLTGSSYREVAKNVCKRLHKRFDTKSIDNALLRIRKKAKHLLEHCKIDELPIFMPKYD